MSTVPIEHATEEIQRHIDRNPPSLLHHYTDQHGLLGIVSTAEIWATSTNNLNDTKEFRHATDSAVLLLRARLSQEKDGTVKRHLGYLLKAAENAGINICVSSWSARCDDLSQWRAYGGSGTGYSIDITGESLNRLAKAQDYILAKCIYDASEQAQLLESLIDSDVRRNMEKERELAPDDEFERTLIELNGGDFGYHLSRYAALFKHPAFASEEEWRLISKPMIVTRMDFRAGKSSIVSYAHFSLKDEKAGERPDGLTAINVESVHVGPCPEPELARTKVQFLLTKYSPLLHHPKVIPSSVPYRTW